MKQLISAEDVSNRLGVPPVTIYAWVRLGQLPSYKLGRRVMFDESEIEAWLEKRYKPAKAAVNQ
jgi:excisionase family DNA binding protein